MADPMTLDSMLTSWGAALTISGVRSADAFMPGMKVDLAGVYLLIRGVLATDHQIAQTGTTSLGLNAKAGVAALLAGFTARAFDYARFDSPLASLLECLGQKGSGLRVGFGVAIPLPASLGCYLPGLRPGGRGKATHVLGACRRART